MRKLLLLVLISLFVMQPSAAQELLQLDQLTSGELTQQSPAAAYFVGLKNGQELHLQVVAATPGLIPQVSLNTATGALVQSIPNSGNSPSLEANLTANADGIFRLDISSVNGSSGKFVLLLQAIVPLEADAALSLDKPTADTLQPNASIVYAVNGDSESRQIATILLTNPQDSLTVQLLSASGTPIASIETQEDGGELLIPARNTEYQLKLDNAQQTAVDYEITLEALDTLVSTPAPPATTFATLPATAPVLCTVTPLNIPVNVRRGPSTRFETFMSLQLGATLTAVARDPEATWYQVDTNSTSLGWVSASVVSAQGPCANLQVVFIATPTLPPVTSTPMPLDTEVAQQQCDPFQFYQPEDNGAYMTISLPAGKVNAVIDFKDGYHTQYVFPTCRAILWTSVTFTCRQYGGGKPYWQIGDFAAFDWNATCGSNTNTNQRGLSFGVR